MAGQKLLGVAPHLYCRPLTWRLQQEQMFELAIDTPAMIAIKLRGRDLHAAFLSPIDYARGSSEYRIVPNVAVSSSEPVGAIALYFRHGIRDMKRVAVDLSSSSEIVLTKIVLSEEFDVQPTFVPVMGALDAMLQKADAALLSGNDSLREASLHQEMLDIGEAWSELTDLPYVHGLWCAREGDLKGPEIEMLQQAGHAGAEMLEQIASEDSVLGMFPSRSSGALTEYLQSFSYDLTQGAEAGLREFLRYAYFHGILPDVADLNFSFRGEPDTGDAENISLN